MNRDELMKTKVYQMFSEDVEKFGGLDKVLAWSRERFPQFANNLRILFEMWLRIYLNVRSVAIRNKRVLLKDLALNDKGTVELIIGLKQRSFSYKACPICRKKVNGNICPAHGTVNPIMVSFDYYTGADESGEVIVKFPPKVSTRDYSGMKIRAFGQLVEDRNGVVFNVFKVYECKEITVDDEYVTVARKLKESRKMRLTAFRSILKMRGLSEKVFFERYKDNLEINDEFVYWRG